MPSGPHEERRLPKSAAPGRATPLLRPIWDVKKNALMAYRPASRDVAGGPLHIADPTVLVEVIRALPLWQKAEPIILSILPVDTRMVTDDHGFGVLVDVVTALPDSARRRLVVEIGPFLPGQSWSVSPKLAKALVEHCRGVICLASIDERLFDGFRRVGAFAVGFDLTEGVARGEAELMDRMGVFVRRANEARLKVIGHGIRSVSLATSAVCAGVNFMSGDAIHACISSNPGPLRFHPVHLFTPGAPLSVIR